MNDTILKTSIVRGGVIGIASDSTRAELEGEVGTSFLHPGSGRVTSHSTFWYYFLGIECSEQAKPSHAVSFQDTFDNPAAAFSCH